VATWRARTKGTRLEVTIEPFGRLARPAREAISAEAEGIAPFRRSETPRSPSTARPASGPKLGAQLARGLRGAPGAGRCSGDGART
jgi:hypothetical protein